MTAVRRPRRGVLRKNPREPRPLTLALFAASFLIAATDAPARTAVWIDTDPSIGPPWREVDDAFALVLAFHSPEARIVGLSSTYGNVGVKRTTTVARDLVRRFGGSARLTTDDVYPGAKSRDDVGAATAASEALARVLRNERLTYIALGPLTNLASFLRLHPGLAGRIERVLFVGGLSPGYSPAFGPKRTWRIHDANVFKDPAAVREVLQSDIPIVLAPVEASSQLWLDRDDMLALRGSGPAGEFLYSRSRVWLWFWTSVVKEDGGLLFDALALMAATRPELLVYETRYATVDPRGNLIAAKRRMRGARAVAFCSRVKPAARDLLVRWLQTRRR